MKCDELKYERLGDAFNDYPDSTLVIRKQYVDEAIAELKADKAQLEADKVIADLEESHKKEVGQLLIEIAELKSEIERLEILCANYRHDCDNLAISNEQVKRAASTLLKKMNHHKYKRCFAMFDKCQVRVAHCQLLERYEQRDWWRKWMFKWLELADKLKEAK